MPRKSLPGADRIGKQQRSADKVAATKELRRHKQLCDTCHRAGSKVDEYCNAGWQLAKRIHIARVADVRAQIREAHGQGMLFDGKGE